MSNDAAAESQFLQDIDIYLTQVNDLIVHRFGMEKPKFDAVQDVEH